MWAVAVSNPIEYATEFVLKTVADMKKAKRSAVHRKRLGWKGPFLGK
jgi:hypothetical protein